MLWKNMTAYPVEACIVGGLGAIVLSLLITIAVLSAQPTCEERGGVKVRRGSTPITTMAGKTPITTMVPNYVCITETVTYEEVR